MDTLQQGAAPMALADMPMTPDGTVDFRRLAVGLVEGCVNAAMEMAVEEIAGEEGVRRNGYRERLQLYNTRKHSLSKARIIRKGAVHKPLSMGPLMYPPDSSRILSSQISKEGVIALSLSQRSRTIPQQLEKMLAFFCCSR